MDVLSDALRGLWEGILSLTAQLILPDWEFVIRLIPLALLGIVAVYLAWIVRRFATAGPTQRGPGRIMPAPPPGIHMPGPSYAPVIAAIGTFLVLFGLVAGGIALWVGLAALVLGLLYWGREGLRDYDHLVNGEQHAVAVVREPPPGIHLPGPSFRPILVSLATAVLLVGLVFGGWLIVVGVIFLVVTLLGWLNDARKEYLKTVEADETGHLENIPAPRPPAALVTIFGMLFIGAVVLNLGLLAGDASGEPGGGGGPAPTDVPPSDADFTVVSADITFDTKELSVTAGEPFTIEHRNEDPASVLHDIDIRAEDGTVIANTQIIPGGETMIYSYEPLEAGTYTFICSIHPIPSMTGTVTAQ